MHLFRPKLPSVTLAMIVRDEEAFLPGCLEAARPHVDEIIVVDTGSVDSTVEIARGYGATVHSFEWCDDFAAARNFALVQATSEWVLILDADDRLLPAGAHAVKCALTIGTVMPGGAQVHGYRFSIEERALDGTSLECALSSVRLFPNTPELRYVGTVHEEVRWLPTPSSTADAIIDGGPHIAHYGSDPSLLPAKDERNLRLLTQRVKASPDDAYAWYYLARQHWQMGRIHEAVESASRGLDNTGALHPDHAAQLQRFVSEQAVVVS